MPGVAASFESVYHAVRSANFDLDPQYGASVQLPYAKELGEATISLTAVDGWIDRQLNLHPMRAIQVQLKQGRDTYTHRVFKLSNGDVIPDINVTEGRKKRHIIIPPGNYAVAVKSFLDLAAEHI